MSITSNNQSKEQSINELMSGGKDESLGKKRGIDLSSSSPKSKNIDDKEYPYILNKTIVLYDKDEEKKNFEDDIGK